MSTLSAYILPPPALVMRIVCLSLFVALGGIGSASAGPLSTRSHYVVVPGSINEVDLLIADATGVASMALTVNYDPNLLALLAVTNKAGSLGADFQIESCGGDGSANIVLTRQEALASGSGVVATLVFRVNSGATPGMSCELPVVRHELSGQYGAPLDVAPVDGEANGKLWVVASMTADCDGDGIPDAWEITNFGGPTNAAPEADDDHDGQSNGCEFRSGTNPNDLADCLRVKHLDAGPQGGRGLVIRWSSVPDVYYAVERSTNLMTGFEGVASNLVTGGVEGSYTDETATVECPNFYRVLVK